MMAITRLSTLPLVHALGWALLHFFWQGAMVAFLLAIVLGIIPQSASRMRYAASCAAMSLMVLLPLITFAVLAVDSQQAAQRFPVELSAGYFASISPADLRQPAEPWEIRCEKALNHAMPCVIAFWLAGIIVLLFRLNLGLLAARKMRFVGVEPASAELRNELQTLCIRLGIRRPINLLNSIRVQVPTVIGWLRPAILIPIGCITGLSSAQIEAVLAHELAHIRRHDYLVSLFQCVVETVLFYHPAVWWVSNRIRREREHCCDDLAIVVSGDRLAYAKALTFLETSRGPSPAGAVTATGGVLKMRIARLLGVNENPAFPRTAAVILLAIAGAFAGLAILQAARAQSSPQQKAASSGQITGNNTIMYDQWLNQDVRWIITTKEKQAFLRLKNSQERDAFIEQFWNRRNPNPGSPVNKFRQEHYRRIAYANEHFAHTGEPGWATDRGHVYIVFGPPDSIDAHSSGANNSEKPFETWHYRSIQLKEPATKNSNGSGYRAPATITKRGVDFRFVDECACGQYELMSPWPSVEGASKPKDASRAAGGAATDLLIHSNTEGVDFSGWIAIWRHATLSRFDSLMPAAHQKAGEAIIRFRILPNGHVMHGSMVLERSSGDVAFDRAAWSAVTGSNYPPLPIAFGGPYLELRAAFTNSIPPENRTQVPGSAPRSGAQQASDVHVRVHTLHIISSDLPQSTKVQISQALSGGIDSLRVLSELVREQLRNRGYLEARVQIQNLAGLLASPPTHPIDVSVLVYAGAQYRLGAIVVEGARAFSEKEILKQFPIHPGDMFNSTEIGKGLDHLKKLYGSKGYTHFGAIPSLQMDDKQTTATLNLKIDEGKSTADRSHVSGAAPQPLQFERTPPAL